MKKVEIEIPPQYADLLVQQAAEQEISVDELVENAIRKLLERNIEDVRN